MAGFLFSNSNPSEEEGLRKLNHSGEFSIVKESPRTPLSKVKPSNSQIIEWLTEANCPHSKEELIAHWNTALNKTIGIIEEGDRNSVEIYSYKIEPDNDIISSFLNKSTYVTREQIYNYPELLPPFYPGDKTLIFPKDAWFGDEKADWVSLLPIQGRYQVPDWRYFEP